MFQIPGLDNEKITCKMKFRVFCSIVLNERRVGYAKKLKGESHIAAKLCLLNCIKARQMTCLFPHGIVLQVSVWISLTGHQYRPCGIYMAT